jgi:hypothetical protein
LACTLEIAYGRPITEGWLFGHGREVISCQDN